MPDPIKSEAKSEPIFNVPTVVVLTLACLAIVHGVRSFLLDPEQDFQVILALAFIPGRYGFDMGALNAARFWSPFSYSLLHGDWMHLAFNGFWLLAFGGLVARRIGALRYVAFWLVTAAAAAATHYIFHSTGTAPVIGASGAVSGLMGAASRFAFNGRGLKDRNVHQSPRTGLVASLKNRTALFFVLIWFASNILFGTGMVDLTGTGSRVAWEAHIGGFLAGYLLFSFFDRAETHDFGDPSEPAS